MSAFSWGNANNFISPLRRFAAGVVAAFFLAVPGVQANHLPAPITLINLIPFDDLLIPVPVPFHPDGVPLTGDFNGDGWTDLLVQAPNGSGATHLFYATAPCATASAACKYNAAFQQRWDAAHLGLAWGSDASTLYVGDYNSDGRADLILESRVAGGRNALLYSNASGTNSTAFDTAAQTWDNPLPNEAAAPSTVNTTANATATVDQITVITLIPFDDLLIPVPALFNPSGVRFKADLNGDGKLDIFIQALKPGDTNYIVLADANNKYTAISQSWSGAHLGIADWSAQSVSIRVDNGQLVVWTNDPTGTITRITSAASAPGKVTLSVTNVWDNSQPAVGTTVGAFAVSPTGAATYTIPLTVPPGVAGMTPSLSLHYSSQSGNGLLGMGWSLGGLSTIHRCPRTVAQDSAVGGINLDANDRFCLDGQRLVVVGGVAYGAVNAEYRTEADSFARVVSSGGTPGDPQSFTVYTKDGQVLEYGVTGDARIEAQGKTQARLWAINGIRDHKGNAITFSYTEDNASGEYYPRAINYPKGRKVEFSYQTRPENISGYVAGSQVAITQRITNIKTYVTNNTLVRDYRFNYEISATTSRSRLLGVQECGVAECLAPTTFGWQKGVAATFSALVEPEPGFQDFDGNGQRDVLGNLMPVTHSHCTGSSYQGRVYLNGASPYYGVSQGFTTNSSGYPIVTWLGFADNARVATFNDDQKSDVIWWEYTYAPPTPTNPDNCLSNFGSTPSGSQWYISYFSEIESYYWPDGSFAGNRQKASKIPLDWSVGHIADFNADGKADAIEIGRTAAVFISGQPHWKPTGTIFLRFSTGGAFTAQDPNAAATGYAGDISGRNLRVGDINGDGKPDLVELNGGSFYYWLSTGTGFSSRQTGGSGYTTAAKVWLRDANSDGKADLVEFDAATSNLAYVWLSTGAGFDAKVASSEGYTATDILATVTTGLGVTTAVEYQSLADTGAIPGSTTANLNQLNLLGGLYTGYAPASHVQYNYGGLRLGLQVVKNYTTSNGLGSGTNKTDYTYTGAGLDNTGRGFLGFATVTATDQAAQIATATTYLQEFPNIGAVSGLTRKTVGTTAVPSKTLYSLANTWLPASISGCFSDAGVRFRCLTGSTENKYEPTNNTAITVNTTFPSYYNPYGNPISITVTTSGAGTYTQATDYAYEHSTTPAPSLSTWYKIGQLKSSTTVSTASRLWGDIYDQGPSARKISYTYGADGLLNTETIEPDKAATDPAKQTTTYTYDAFGNRRTATVSGAGLTAARTTTTDYGSDGQFPLRVVNPAGHVETAVFDARFGVPSRVTDANGLVTTRYYDDFGRLTREVRPDATQSSITYYRCFYGCQANEAYYITTQTAGAPTVTVYYDMLGRDIRRVSDGFNGTPASTETLYDARGRVIQATQPHYQGAASDATRYEYDDLNRVTKQTAPDGGITRTTYPGLTADGNAATITDARGFITTRYTNALGQVSRINAPPVASGTGITRYDYDHFGNLRYIKDADGHETLMGYDVRGRRTLLSDLDKGATCRTTTNINCGAWRYEYNAAGELTKQTDAKAQVTTLGYDTLGRPTARSEAEGTSQWVYDTAANGKGKPASVTGPATVGDKKVYTYDTLSRPVRIATTIDGITYSEDTGYDQYSRIGAISYPETSAGVRLKLHYNYTASGYLSNITNVVTGIVYWRATAQDAAGRPLQEHLGNGLTTSRSYDAVGRLKTLQTGASIQNLSYTYDLAGNLTTRQNTAQSFSETFAYDALNRLTGVTGPAPKTYAYSLDGNITHKSDVSDVGGYLYGTTAPAGPHALTSLRKNNAVVASYTYDNNGNMLTGAGRSYTYTSYNLPKTITQGAATTSFAYSAERVRIKQTAPGETTVYINPRWDAGTHYEKTTKPITGGSVTEHQHYLYGSSGPVAVHKVIATTTGTGTTTSSHTRYLHHDHLGSVDAITSDTGALVERLSYDAWGKRRQPNGLDATTAPIPATTHHGYTGHEHLDGLGLIHMNARVYDPAIGRFTSADPIGFEGGINLYGYANNNPINFIDLLGLFESSPYLRATVPGQVSFDNGVTAVENRNYGSAAVYFGAMLAEQTLTALTFGQTQAAALLSRFGSLFRAEEIVGSSVPSRLARVVDARFGNSARLGGPTADDVFVTAADDIAGITNSTDLARRLTLLDDVGKLRTGPFTVIEFDNPITGLASPVFRTNPGFLQGGFTRGGAQEYVLPNLKADDLGDLTRRLVE